MDGFGAWQLPSCSAFCNVSFPRIVLPVLFFMCLPLVITTCSEVPFFPFGYILQMKVYLILGRKIFYRQIPCFQPTSVVNLVLSPNFLFCTENHLFAVLLHLLHQNYRKVQIVIFLVFLYFLSNKNYSSRQT